MRGLTRFGRDRRIRKSAEFGAILKGGGRAGTTFVSIAFVPTSDPGRIGISASTRIGGSVQRNRARRMVREYYRQAFLDVPYDIVVNLKPGFAELSSIQVREALDHVFAKAIATGKQLRRHSPALR